MKKIKFIAVTALSILVILGFFAFIKSYDKENIKMVDYLWELVLFSMLSFTTFYYALSNSNEKYKDIFVSLGALGTVILFIFAGINYISFELKVNSLKNFSTFIGLLGLIAISISLVYCTYTLIESSLKRKKIKRYKI